MELRRTTAGWDQDSSGGSADLSPSGQRSERYPAAGPCRAATTSLLRGACALVMPLCA